MTKSRGIRLKPYHVWTWAELELVKRNYHNSLTRDLATALGLSIEQVYRKAHQLGLQKEPGFTAEVARERALDPAHPMRATSFKKGNVPVNKGVTRPAGWSPGNMARTQFKKGNISHTWKPVGSYRVNADRYLEVKFCDAPGPWMNRWKSVHVLIWEQANGPVPAGLVVAFKKGRYSIKPEEVTLDALECISRRELMARNTIHNLPVPLKEVSQLRGALARAIKRREAP
jgi:hypothetical protein